MHREVACTEPCLRPTDEGSCGNSEGKECHGSHGKEQTSPKRNRRLRVATLQAVVLRNGRIANWLPKVQGQRCTVAPSSRPQTSRCRASGHWRDLPQQNLSSCITK